MRKFLQRTVVIGTTVAVTALGAGAAYAFVAASGTGSSSQSATSAANYRLDVTVSQPATLVPGTTQTVTVTVTNRGPAKVRISTATLSLGILPSGVDQAAYDTIKLNQPAVLAQVLDKDETTTFTGSIQIQDSATVDQTSLLDKTFTLNANVS